MIDCLLGLGANLGDSAATLTAATERLRKIPDTEVSGISSFHSTSPIGGPPNQPRFTNAAARLRTVLAPLELLDQLQAIEFEFARQRHERWDARTLDIDLLLYGDWTVHEPRLEVPHPRFAFRYFALAPAAEIAADMFHPTAGWTVGQLLAHLNTAAPVTLLGGDDPREVHEIATRATLATGATLQATDGVALSQPPIFSLRLPRPGPALPPKLLVWIGSGSVAFRGPVLRLPRHDVELAVAEVSAAMLASDAGG